LISNENLKNKEGHRRIVAVIIIIAIVVVVSIVTASCTTPNSSAEKPEYLPLEKISDVTSTVYRVIDEDYGIVLYVVDTYSLATAPSISGVRVGEIKATIQDGTSQLTEKPVIYRLVDSEMNTISYIVDTYGLATAPSIVSFPLE